MIKIDSRRISAIDLDKSCPYFAHKKGIVRLDTQGVCVGARYSLFV